MRSTSSQAPSSADGVDSLQDMAVFVLMGKTGAGKSSFIKLLGGREIVTGKEPAVSDGISSCTRKPIIYVAMIGNKQIALLDTPGFDDSAEENLTLVYDIMSRLYGFATRKIKIHGVIFLHDISEVRYSGSQKKTFSILQSIVGEENMGSVIIGTTMWSPSTQPRFKNEEKREKNIQTEHWSSIYKTTRLFYEDKDAAKGIITDLLARPPVLLLGQKEMLRPPHSVEQTTVGSILIPEGIRELANSGEKGTLQSIIDKLSKPTELSFAEKLGLAVVAPIVLAPAALVSAPVGVVAALVHLAKKAGG